MILLGLDLSTRAAAAVCVPVDWDGQWGRVSSLVVGEKLTQAATDAGRARRTETIATRLVAFARQHGAIEAWIEGYAFSTHRGAHTLGELGGVVRLELLRAGIGLHTSNMSTARKLLLSKVPRTDAKAAVFSALRSAGARFQTLDESDAFCAVNLGLAEYGAYCFAQAAA